VRRHKYNVSPKAERTADEVVFASKWECRAYVLLKQMIGRDYFELQPSYELQPKFQFAGKAVRAIKYVGDFLVRTDSEDYVVDTKGIETDVFKIKEKMFKFKFGKEIVKLKRPSQLVDFVNKLKDIKKC